jgi:hypothetical protein
MKKRLIIMLAIIAIFTIVLGCISKPEPPPAVPTAAPTPEPPPTPKPTPPPPPPPQIIEHKTSDFGGEVPEWLSMDALDLEQQEAYVNHYVFIEDHPGGKDLMGLKAWAKNFSAKDAVASMVSNRVKSKFVGALAGDIDMVETYMEQVVKSVAEAEFSGLRVNEDFWVKKRYYNSDGEVESEEYRYLFLITVPRKAINDAIKRAFDETTPETEEERSAIDRVKDSWGDDL